VRSQFSGPRSLDAALNKLRCLEESSKAIPASRVIAAGLHGIFPAERMGVGEIAARARHRPAWIRVANWK
jgi:hypothetical protein